MTDERSPVSTAAERVSNFSVAFSKIRERNMAIIIIIYYMLPLYIIYVYIHVKYITTNDIISIIITIITTYYLSVIINYLLLHISLL